MKILLITQLFAPSIGGMESVNRLLSEGLADLGHEVVVATEVAGEVKGAGYTIVRQPSFLALCRLVRECDLIWCCNLSLKRLPQLALASFLRKPVVITQHTWYRRVSGYRTILDRLKIWLSSLYTNIAVSQAIGRELRGEVSVIENPYDDRLFRTTGIERTKDLVFLGRLVSDKGIDTLVRSLVLLRRENIAPNVTVIGEGPERELVQELIKRSGLVSQFSFIGVKEGSELVDILNRHKILVVPSRWDEPYGIVALEGAACGLLVIGSRGGGLAEAIGPCGVLFANRNPYDLAERVAAALKGELSRDEQAVERHLAARGRDEVSREYERLFLRKLGEANLPSTDSVRGDRPLSS